MNDELTNKEKKDLINSMEVIDSDSCDGEMLYVVVEDNEDNRTILKEVGLSDEQIEEMVVEDGEIDITSIGFEYSEYFDSELGFL